MYSRKIHKPTLACENRRERRLPFADYTKREREPLLLQRKGMF
jgi:hypothetical protein